MVAWMLALQMLMLAPHLTRLPLWVGALALGLGGWRLLLAWRSPGRMPGGWLLVAITLLATTAVVLTYGHLLGPEEGVALLVLMWALKLLETRTERDVMLVLLLGYFLVITNFMYSQSVLMALYMLGTVLLTTTLIVAVQQPALARPRSAELRLALTLLGQATPLMVVLFLLFPRVSGPLWGMPSTSEGMTGVSDRMAPGGLSKLIQSREIAFRVNFRGAIPDPSALYWRGPVLGYYDGWSWSVGWPAGHRLPPLRDLGEPIDYVVTLEPHKYGWLYALDMPAGAPPGATLDADYTLSLPEPVGQRQRYALRSYLHYRLGETTFDGYARRRALQLPKSGNPRTRALAHTWRSESRSDREIVFRALQLFRDEAFYYTLSPPLLDDDPVDDFLFETRRGFCEHYASAFVLLMRAADVPARVVAGYQGGELNPVGDYLIVRQSDAHAWAEVWLSDAGWTRVDPTVAVAPERVERGLEAALPAGESQTLLAARGAAWLHPVILAWDALNHRWDYWVLGYGTARQAELLASLGLNARHWQELVVALVAAAATLLGGVFALMRWRGGGAQPADPVLRSYRRYCAKLARVGLARRPSEGPLDYAARVRRARPDLGSRSDLITRLYIVLHYGSGGPPRAEERLRRLVRHFRPG